MTQKEKKDDVVAPKAKKPKKAKDKGPLGPKLVAGAVKPPLAGKGHNSGEKIPALVELMDEDIALDLKKKEIGKAQRDIRNRAKNEFGVLAWNWNHEKQMRKVDKDVRIQRESGSVDLKNMLGFQIELDLKPDTVERTENQLADPGAPRDDIINRMG